MDAPWGKFLFFRFIIPISIALIYMLCLNNLNVWCIFGEKNVGNILKTFCSTLNLWIGEFVVSFFGVTNRLYYSCRYREDRAIEISLNSYFEILLESKISTRCHSRKKAISEQGNFQQSITKCFWCIKCYKNTNLLMWQLEICVYFKSSSQTE